MVVLFFLLDLSEMKSYWGKDFHPDFVKILIFKKGNLEAGIFILVFWKFWSLEGAVALKINVGTLGTWPYYNRAGDTVGS